MTIDRHNHQAFGENGVKGGVLFEVFEAMLCEVLDVFGTLLKRVRHCLYPLAVKRRFTDLFAERVIAVVRVGGQHEYGNRIGFVEPQKNCTFELADGGFLLVRDNDGRTRLWSRLSARLSHCWRFRTTYSRPFVVSPYLPDVSTQSPIAPNPWKPTPVCSINPSRTKTSR